MHAALGLSVIPEGVPAAQFLVLGVLSAVIMGAAKAGFAGSIGILSVPLLIYACGDNAELALGMMLPLLIACDYVAVVHWRGKWDWRNVKLLLPGVFVGIVLGSVALGMFLTLGEGRRGQDTSNAAIRLAIGLLALGFVVLQIYRAKRARTKPYRPGGLGGFLVGSAAGFTSTLSHSAGPITTMFLLPQNMPKARYVATATLYYWIGNQAKVPAYLLVGWITREALFTRESLAGSAALMPAVIAGALLGIFVHHRIHQKWFTLVVYALLTIVGAHLTYKSVVELWF